MGQLYRRLRPGPGREAPLVESHQRERIQRAMIDLVAEGGYEAVTVRRLAGLARVSTGTFYAQFGGKEECFVSTFTMVMDQIRQRVADARSASRPREAQLRLTVQRILNGYSADPEATQVALVESFDGGPAALERIRAQETALDEAVRGTLERRERPPLSPAISSWITAGCLRIARAAPIADRAGPSPGPVGELMEWGQSYLDEASPDLAGLDEPAGGGLSDADLSALGTELGRGGNGFGEERDLILAAVLRLAARDGYWRLSIPGIRAAAGLSRARFNRHFRTVDDCYIAAIRTVSSRYAKRMSAGEEVRLDWAPAVCRDISDLCAAIAANAAIAKLVFVDILAPGVSGMRCREEMITDFSAAWRAGAPSSKRPSQLTAEATMAALWMAIAQHLERGEADRLPREAETLSFVMLAPVLGVGESVAVIEAERSRESPSEQAGVAVRAGLKAGEAPAM
jgi:AcrR family transcriptional regulator